MANPQDGYLLNYPEDISSTFANIEPGETWKQQAFRNIVRTPADVLAGALGAPADVVQGIGSGLSALSHLATGHELPQIPGIGHAARALGSESLKKNVIAPIVETVAPKGYLNPKGGPEESISNIAQTFGALAAGGGGVAGRVAKYSPALGKALSLLGNGLTKGKAFLYAAAPEVASALSKKFGASEGLGEGIRFATALALPMIGTKANIKNINKAIYDTARSAIPEEATIASHTSENALNKLKKYVKSGDTTLPSKKEVSELIAGVTPHFNEGKASVEQLWALKKDLNERLYDLPNKLNSDARRLVHGLNAAVRENLNEYAKINPEFGSAFKEAETLFSGLRPLSAIKEFAENHLPGSTSPGTYGFFKTKGIPYIGSTIESNVKLLGNKDVRKYYMESLKHAYAQNEKQFARSILKLDKAVQENNPVPGEGDYVLTFPS